MTTLCTGEGRNDEATFADTWNRSKILVHTIIRTNSTPIEGQSRKFVVPSDYVGHLLGHLDANDAHYSKIPTCATSLESWPRCPYHRRRRNQFRERLRQDGVRR